MTRSLHDRVQIFPREPGVKQVIVDNEYVADLVRVGYKRWHCIPAKGASFQMDFECDKLETAKFKCKEFVQDLTRRQKA